MTLEAEAVEAEPSGNATASASLTDTPKNSYSTYLL